jgi:hypothetical protein
MYSKAVSDLDVFDPVNGKKEASYACGVTKYSHK